MPAPTVSLVVPAYEESRRLPALLDAISDTAAGDLAAAGMDLVQAVVVDDGSADGTGDILREAAGRIETLDPVVLPPPNGGKGAAVAAGLRHARGDLVLLSDVDLSTPLSEAAKLMDLLRAGADVAIGSRAIDRSLAATPPHREYLGRCFNVAVRLGTPLRFRDTQCGFKLMPAATARALTRRQHVKGFAYDVEVLMRARLAGLHVAEAPVLYHHDDDSRVGLVGAPVQMLLDLARLIHRLPSEKVSPAGARES